MNKSYNNYNSEDHDNNVENNPLFSIPFSYPVDEPDDSNPSDERSKEMLIKLSNFILTQRNPLANLIGLFYCSGIDLTRILECEQTLSSIARRIGVPKQSLYGICKRIRTDFDLTKSSSIKYKSQKGLKLKNVKKYPRHLDSILRELSRMDSKDQTEALEYIEHRLQIYNLRKSAI